MAAEIVGSGFFRTISSEIVVPAARVLKPVSVRTAGLLGALGRFPATSFSVIGIELFLGAKLAP
jgi:hypothetical protein